MIVRNQVFIIGLQFLLQDEGLAKLFTLLKINGFHIIGEALPELSIVLQLSQLDYSRAMLIIVLVLKALLRCLVGFELSHYLIKVHIILPEVVSQIESTGIGRWMPVYANLI